MSDTAQQIGQMLNDPTGGSGSQSTEPPPAPPVDNQQAPDEGQGSEPDYSLASDFLQRVPEAERPIVEKYVKQWDAGVTRRFQELHGKYQPYEQLGDIEQLNNAINVMRLLDENPEVIYGLLLEDIQKGAEWAQRLQGQDQSQQQQNLGGANIEDAFQGIPSEFVSRFEQQQTMIENLAKIVLASQQEQIAEQEDMELVNYLKNLHTEFGDFDEDYVLARMERGEDGAEAVKAFQDLIQAQVNAALQSQNNLPPVLSGAGVPPVNPQRVQDLDTKTTRNLVAELMKATVSQDQ